jgi:hypothetical protein
MTGWDVQPFLIPDALLEELMAAYGARREVTGPTPPRSATCTVPDAAASIARAAERGMARRMHQVRCDSIVWVRLEGEAHAEDLMVRLEHPQEETSWQAALTPH